MLPLLLAALPLQPLPEELHPPARTVQRAPPSVSLTTSRLAGVAGLLLSSVPAASGTTAALLPLTDETRDARTVLGLSAGFSSALAVVPWAATGFSVRGQGARLRLTGLSLAMTSFASSTAMLVTGTPSDELLFQVWSIGQGVVGAAGVVLVSLGTLQDGNAREDETSARVVQLSPSMRVLNPVSGTGERPFVAGVMGRF